MNRAVVFVWWVLLLGLIVASGARRGRRPRFCNLPAVVGKCRARVERWYYNCKTCSCETFFYGGCGGNKNRFNTKAACHKTCKPKCISMMPCTLTCKAGYAKDKRGCRLCRCVDTCERLHCSDREQCVIRTAQCYVSPCAQIGVCVDMCKLPKVTGRCFGYMPRWYFNSDSHKCEKFIYGGCEGNMNNFETKEECQSWCSCPSLKCHKVCEYGRAFDKSGCPTCECLSHPCAAMLCVEGSMCIPMRIPLVPCNGMNCPPRAVCAKVPRCRRKCRFGYAFDRNLHLTCKCLDNPCAYTLCPRGTRCVPRIVFAPCSGFGCPSRSKCVKENPGSCPQRRPRRFGRRCRADDNCRGRQKCCAFGRRHMCVHP